MFDNNFYFSSIRKLTVAFGDVFNNIKIDRIDTNGITQKTIKIPLAYAPRSHYFATADDKTPKIQTTLPRMSYEITSMDYDPSRKKVTTNYNRASDPNVQEFYRQLNPVPYNIGFQLNLATRTIDDALQVIENILPYFTPDFNIQVKEMPELGIIRDVPIILEGVQMEDTYIGEVGDERVLLTTFSFSTRSYIYPPMTLSKVILKTITSLVEDDKTLTTITHEVTPNTAKVDDDWTVTTTVE